MKHLIELKGLRLEYSTDKEKIVSLIHSLRPYDVGKRLIRLGPNGDGGYLVPDDLEGIEACFSPGVGEISGFEEACSKRGMEVFLADRSVDEPEVSKASDRIHFIKKYVGATTNESTTTIDEWVKSASLKSESDLLLQMDIEGGEYFTILNMSNSLLKRFRIIVIEFHDLNRLWNENFYKSASVVFNKILQTHIVVHIHPNNCLKVYKSKGIKIPVILEFTFIRSDRIGKKTPQITFPHPLDSDNTANPHYALPENWYKTD